MPSRSCTGYIGSSISTTVARSASASAAVAGSAAGLRADHPFRGAITERTAVHDMGASAVLGNGGMVDWRAGSLTRHASMPSSVLGAASRHNRHASEARILVGPVMPPRKASHVRLASALFESSAESPLRGAEDVARDTSTRISPISHPNSLPTGSILDRSCSRLTPPRADANADADATLAGSTNPATPVRSQGHSPTHARGSPETPTPSVTDSTTPLIPVENTDISLNRHSGSSTDGLDPAVAARRARRRGRVFDAATCLDIGRRLASPPSPPEEDTRASRFVSPEEDARARRFVAELRSLGVL